MCQNFEIKSFFCYSRITNCPEGGAVMAYAGRSWAAGIIDLCPKVLETGKLYRVFKRGRFERCWFSQGYILVRNHPKSTFYIPKEWIRAESINENGQYPRIHLKISDAFYLTLGRRSFIRICFSMHRDVDRHRIDGEAGNKLLCMVKQLENKFRAVSLRH